MGCRSTLIGDAAPELGDLTACALTALVPQLPSNLSGILPEDRLTQQSYRLSAAQQKPAELMRQKNRLSRRSSRAVATGPPKAVLARAPSRQRPSRR